MVKPALTLSHSLHIRLQKNLPLKVVNLGVILVDDFQRLIDS
jgi:hypothetical protein